MQQMVRSMLTVVVCAALAAAVQAQQRVALVIGNANYQHESLLRNPVNDARLIERTLKQELGFNQVFSVTNGTRVQLIRELARFRSAAQGAHTALIYYSGHGMINGKRQNFVLPVDMPKIASDASADADAELKSFALSEDDLIEAVEGASDIQLVVLDACRDNGFRTGRSGTKGLSRRADQSRNRLIAYATEEGRVAEDGSGSNSTYAASLARNLVRKELPVLAMFDAVARDVEARTRNKQSPTRTGNLRVDVYLFNPTITVNSNASPSPAQVLRTDPDEEAWKAAQAADSVEGYELYLKDFASGRNVSAARIKLAAVKRRELERPAVAGLSSSQPPSQQPGVSSTSTNSAAGRGHPVVENPTADQLSNRGFAVGAEVRPMCSVKTQTGNVCQLEAFIWSGEPGDAVRHKCSTLQNTVVHNSCTYGYVEGLALLTVPATNRRFVGIFVRGRPAYPLVHTPLNDEKGTLLGVTRVSSSFGCAWFPNWDSRDDKQRPECQLLASAFGPYLMSREGAESLKAGKLDLTRVESNFYDWWRK